MGNWQPFRDLHVSRASETRMDGSDAFNGLTGLGKDVEERGFADIGQSDDADF